MAKKETQKAAKKTSQTLTTETSALQDGPLLDEKQAVTSSTSSSTVTKTGTDNSEWIAGSDGNDTLFGMGGNDLLFSGDGDDYVDAGDGNDVIIGGSGAGNDTYIGGNGVDTVIYSSATQGITVNLAQGKAVGAEIGTDTLASIENLVGGSGDDILTGDNNDNEISGGDGNDQIFGLGGHDFLSGDAGNDYIEGNDGDDTLNGGTGNDTLLGGNGNDVINGGDGNDIINGGAGNDVVTLDLGDDILDGGADTDLLYFGDKTQNVTVNLRNGTVTGAEVGNDTISNFENIQGGAGNDTYINGPQNASITDNAGGADTYFFSFNMGNMTISDFSTGGETDRVILDPLSSSYETLHFARTANNLIITDTAHTGTLTVRNYFNPPETNIEEISIRFVKTLNLADMQQIISNGGSIPHSFVMAPPDIIPHAAHVYTNHNSTVVEHQFLPGTQEFPMLANKQKLKPDELKNGVARENLTLQDDHVVKVNFVGESSNSKNSLGMYIIGPNGEIQDIQILAENLSGTGPKAFGGGTFNPGDLVSNLGLLAAGTEIGFFLLKGGEAKFKKTDLDNGTLHFEVKKTGEIADVNNLGKELKLIYTDGITGKEKNIAGTILHASFDNLNKDTHTHTVSGINESGHLMIGFEEAATKNGDFEDIVIEVVFEPKVVASPEDVPVSSSFLLTDPDDHTFMSAVVEVTQNLQNGDLLKLSGGLTVDINGIVSGTSIHFLQDSAGKITLSGADSVEHYKTVLDALRFNTSTVLGGNDDREVSITVTDFDGLHSSATTTIHYGASDASPIVGSNNDDVIVSTSGDDIMTGGLGNDLFVFDDPAGTDTVTDFDNGRDVISVKDLLSGYDPLQDALSDFVHLTDNGTSSTLSINATGQSGGTFHAAVVLENVSGVTLDDIVNANSLIVA